MFRSHKKSSMFRRTDQPIGIVFTVKVGFPYEKYPAPVIEGLSIDYFSSRTLAFYESES